MNRKPSNGTHSSEQICLDLVLAANTVLAKLWQSPLDSNAAFDLAMFARSIAPLTESYDAARIPLVKKYGTSDLNGQFTVAAENMERFTAELLPLHSKLIDSPVARIKLSSLRSLSLSPSDAAALLPFVDQAS